MPTEFLLASVGAGKTEAAQSRLLALKRAQPLAKTWCLLATERQIYAFRQRLMAHPDAPSVLFNVEFFNFYSLYHHLLETAGKPQRVLDSAARYRLLRLILNRLEREGELELFGGIASTPGFLHVLGDFFYELKQNLNRPEIFGYAAQTDKDRELARMYDLYQYMLNKYDLVDREGEGWVALDELTNNAYLASDVRLLIVDGYDQFNVLQAELLTVLAARAGETLITLTNVGGRETTIGKRFQGAFERLERHHKKENVVHRVSKPVTASASARHPALRHLTEHIFRARPPRIPANGGIHLIEVPDAPAEVSAALRRVKHLLVEGARPDEILVSVRDWTRYGAFFEAQGRAYGIPLAVDARESLVENPAIHALLCLLELHRGGFRRRELLDVLGSVYLDIPGIDREALDLLEQVSRTALVRKGRAAWLAALEAAARTPVVDEDGEPLAETAGLEAKYRALHDSLGRFFDAVTPPRGRSAAEYVEWLEDLIGVDPQDEEQIEEKAEDPEGEDATPYTLSMIVRARDAAEDETQALTARDIAALCELKDLLRGMLSANRLFANLSADELIGWDTFYADLLSTIRAARIPRSSGRDGRVLVTTVTEARGLPHRHVVVLGLCEGVFPMRASEHPLYLDSERMRLRGSGVELPTQDERSDDDGLFYEMISLATDSLTLTRSTVEGGAPLPPSHLWRAVCQVFDDSLRPVTQRVGQVVPVEQAASMREVGLGLAAAYFSGDGTCAPYHAWFTQDHEGMWDHIAHNRAVELRRMSRAPHDHYSGRLHDPVLRAHAGAVFDNRVWSASQLNDYGMCAFRFFAKRLLRLEALDEPEDGMDAAQLGTLYHEILENTYRVLAERAVDIVPENMPLALEVLRETSAALLPDAPARLGFRPPPLWHEQAARIHDRLAALVREDFAPDSKLNGVVTDLGGGVRQPYLQEMPFGGEAGMFTLYLGGEKLRLRGKIDRVDRVGDQAFIIDYKSGSSTIPTSEIKIGRNFQMMIYLLAAEATLRPKLKGILGGAFWHISSLETSGVLQPGHEVIAEGKKHIIEYLERGRKGDFSAEAAKLDSGKCHSYCDYSQMCRMAVMHRRKAQA